MYFFKKLRAYWLMALMALIYLPTQAQNLLTTPRTDQDFYEFVEEERQRTIDAFSEFFTSFDENSHYVTEQYEQLLSAVSRAKSFTQALEAPTWYHRQVKESALELFAFYESVAKNEYKLAMDVYQDGELSEYDHQMLRRIHRSVSDREAGLKQNYVDAVTLFVDAYDLRTEPGGIRVADPMGPAQTDIVE